MAEYYPHEGKMGAPGMMSQGEPAVGIPYGYDQPANPAYIPQDHGYPPPPPAGAYYSKNDGFSSQTDAYPAPHMATSSPHGPGYAPPHGPGYAPPHGPGYAPPHGPGYAPPNGPGYTVPQPGPPGSDLVVYAPPSPHNPMIRNPYTAGVIPPNAIYVNPVGVRLRDTFFGDTPAPFQCQFCSTTGLTIVRSERSVAAYVACMMSACIGICFLLPQCDCLWHKFHYCPHCGQKVGDFTKADPCTVVDPTQWTRTSFGVPA